MLLKNVLDIRSPLTPVALSDTRHEGAIHPQPELFQMLRARAFDVLLPVLLLLFVWLAQGEQ